MAVCEVPFTVYTCPPAPASTPAPVTSANGLCTPHAVQCLIAVDVSPDLLAVQCSCHSQLQGAADRVANVVPQVEVIEAVHTSEAHLCMLPRRPAAKHQPGLVQRRLRALLLVLCCTGFVQHLQGKLRKPGWLPGGAQQL